jgi:hypothetical protein
MRTPDAVLQEVWQIKDAAYEEAGRNADRFVKQLRQRSAELRRGLDLQELLTPEQAPDSSIERHSSAS